MKTIAIIFCLLLTATIASATCPDGSIGPVCNNIAGSVQVNQINNAFNGTTPVQPNGAPVVATYGIHAISPSNSAATNTSNWTALMATLTAGQTVYIPYNATPYQYTNITIPDGIKVVCDGPYSNNWGGTFGQAGFLSHMHGAVLQSTATTGRAIDGWGVSSNNEGGEMDNCVIFGPGADDATTKTITGCTEPGAGSTTATCTSTNHGFSAGSGVVVSGETGETRYNGRWIIQSVTSNTFSFYVKEPALSAGTGGSAKQTSIGLSVGNRPASRYASGVTLHHVMVANFGIGVSFYEQNSFIDTLGVDGNGVGVTSEGNSNALNFAGLKAAGGQWSNLLWIGGNQGDVFQGDFENPAQSDATATHIVLTDCDTCAILGSYVENSTNAFTGNGIVLAGTVNNSDNLIQSTHVFLGSGPPISDINLLGSQGTVLKKDRLADNLIVGSTSYNAYCENSNISTITDNSGGGFWSIGCGAGGGNITGKIGGSAATLFSSGSFSCGSGAGFKATFSSNTDDGWRFDGNTHKLGCAKPFEILTPLTFDSHSIDANGTIPTLGTCTGGSLATGKQDQSFKVTGTTGGSCVVNFGTAFTNEPVINCNDYSASPTVLQITPGTSSVTVAGITSGHTFGCTVRGH